MIDDTQLAEMERLADSASPPPWTEDGEEIPPDEYIRRVSSDSGTVAYDLSSADCAFIAAARLAVPALISEVRRLHAKVVYGTSLLTQALALHRIAMRHLPESLRVAHEEANRCIEEKRAADLVEIAMVPDAGATTSSSAPSSSPSPEAA